MRLSPSFVECGCGECPPRTHPLADKYEGAFDDVISRSDSRAYEECPSPRPLTVDAAREVYLRYQQKGRERGWSLFGDQKDRYGQLLGSERDLLQRYEDPSLIFLSLRLSPVETVGGRRQWIEPVKLSGRLHGGWSNVYGTIRYYLDDVLGLDWGWKAVTAGTTSAGTPHTHVSILADDPGDDTTIDMVASMVDSHVNNVTGSYEEDHPVERGQRDAGMLFHDPPTVDIVAGDDDGEGIPEDTAVDVYHARGDDGFPLVTVPTYYMMNQLPHWVLKNVYDGTSDIHADSPLVDAAATAWADPYHWVRWGKDTTINDGEGWG